MGSCLLITLHGTLEGERERERESLGPARYVDERECTHYCALAPDNVPGPSCWGVLREIYVVTQALLLNVMST